MATATQPPYLQRLRVIIVVLFNIFRSAPLAFFSFQQATPLIDVRIRPTVLPFPLSRRKIRIHRPRIPHIRRMTPTTIPLRQPIILFTTLATRCLSHEIIVSRKLRPVHQNHTFSWGKKTWEGPAPEGERTRRIGWERVGQGDAATIRRGVEPTRAGRSSGARIARGG